MIVRKKTVLFADNSGFLEVPRRNNKLLHLIRVSVGQLSTQNIHVFSPIPKIVRKCNEKNILCITAIKIEKCLEIRFAQNIQNLQKI